jgi:superfamily II DNA or RNA helicase
MRTKGLDMNYDQFLERKTQVGSLHGFDPVWMPDKLFLFQKALVEWAIRKGRAAIFADCGLGKTAMQLTWAENVARKTNGRVLILTPLAVAFQTVSEGSKFGIDVVQRRTGLVAGDRIVVANYERLHHFLPEDFQGVVCDESSVLKNFDGETRKAVTDFMRKRPYRLLCTATAAPNDYIELGTSSEAIGEMGAQDMMNKFFKKTESTSTARQEHMAGFFRLRPHAEHDFWRWVCSWARAMRKPSDLGFDDSGYDLPELKINQHTVKANRPRDGYLFDLPAVGLAEQRSDLRRTIDERCQTVAQLVNAHNQPSLVWCNLNEEGKRLTKLIPGSVEVSGSDDESHKEEAFAGFIKKSIRVLITKPTIGGFGLNFQHCAHQTFFPSHSYEQFYQGIRRCWRFGQQKPVVVDMITTDGQENVLASLQRKTEAAETMFANLVSMMSDELKIRKRNDYTTKEEVPTWL